MSAPFVSELRNDGEVIVLPGGEGPVMHLRVQVAELWDAIRVDAPGEATVAAVRNAALTEFFPAGVDPEDFVTKVRGFEVLHENQSLAASGVRDGSTLLLSHRRRRAVK